MMKRLTERTKYGIVGNNDKVSNYPLYKVAEYDELDHGIVGQCFDKLAEYEDAEERGLLLRLPCKVGDTVYAYCSEFGILAYTVYCIVIDKHITYQCGAYSESIGYCPGECLDEIEPDISDFGKTVFLTQAEAEQKLKEMESD